MIGTTHRGLVITKSVYLCNNIFSYIIPYYRDRPHLKSHVRFFICIYCPGMEVCLCYIRGVQGHFLFYYVLFVLMEFRVEDTQHNL